MGNRDFKGVWIPKEIWLNTDLTMLDKAILVEIDSLDGDNHCTASNEYFATFCDCSERKVSESVNKLTTMGYIEIISFNGRQRVIKSLLKSMSTCSMQGRKNCEAESQNFLSNNIDNNIDNNIIFINKNNTSRPGITVNSDKETSTDDNCSKDEFDGHSYSKEDFFGCVKRKADKKTSGPRKKSLFEKCQDEILIYTKNLILQDSLLKYLRIRFAMSDKKLYGVNQWVGMLNRLSDISGESALDKSVSKRLEIVNQSIEKGWASFYPINSDYKKRDKFAEYGTVDCTKHFDEELVDEEF